MRESRPKSIVKSEIIDIVPELIKQDRRTVKLKHFEPSYYKHQ